MCLRAVLLELQKQGNVKAQVLLVGITEQYPSSLESPLKVKNTITHPLHHSELWETTHPQFENFAGTFLLLGPSSQHQFKHPSSNGKNSIG